MPVRVNLIANLGVPSETLKGLTVDGAANAGEVLRAIEARVPAIAGKLFENGQLRPFLRVMVNDEDVRFHEDLDTPVKDDDEVTVFAGVGGASSRTIGEATPPDK